MMNKRTIPFVVFMACLAPAPGFADMVGDPAAPLTVKEWIKGKPVNVKAGTNIYVVEFWAGLSPASRAIIPKLNELQKKFKDKGVVVVGISDEPADKVRQFVELRAEIDYVVAADDQRKTGRDYMVAYGQNGIPYAFIVGKDGKMLWHGHPVAGLDQALEAITSGHYDLAAAIKVDAARAAVDEYRTLARVGDPTAKPLGRKILADRTNDVGRLIDFAYRIVTDVKNKHCDFALAGEALDQAEKAAGGKTPELVVARGVVLFESGKKTEGIALAKQAIDLAKDAKQKEALEKYISVLEGRATAESKSKRKSRQMPPERSEQKAPVTAP